MQANLTPGSPVTSDPGEMYPAQIKIRHLDPMLQHGRLMAHDRPATDPVIDRRGGENMAPDRPVPDIA